ncbi:MAG: DUF2341 domain-containing protein [Candidatus Caenarcaniphilales bacterium]|nr:DUF2341 domain-containing protein [Candidatus Caenarcaniphilales bacterium]
MTDQNGFSQESIDTLTIVPWSITGLDSVDTGGIYGDITDGNPTNTINQGTTSILMTGGVNNPGALTLDYTFQIDSDSDGTFETIDTRTESTTYGTFYDYRWGENRHVTYDPSSLAAGSYNTKLIVTDQNGFSQEAFDSFTVGSSAVGAWSLSGLDSIDGDKVFGGADSNATNTITPNTIEIYLSAGVDNASNTALTYQFQIDSDNDGTFEDIGQASSDSSEGTSIFYSPFNLSAGTYNTKVIVSDSEGTSLETTDQFTVASDWSLSGLDSIDGDKVFGGSDSNAANVITPNTIEIYLSAGVDNASNTALTYQFQIDTDNDGIFEDIGTVSSNSSEGSSIFYSPFNLSAGTYNTKVIVSDSIGTSLEAFDQFTVSEVVEWSLNNLDSIDQTGPLDPSDSNLNNEVVQGTNFIKLTANILNPDNALLTYTFQIDSDNDGVFEDIASNISSTSEVGQSTNFSTQILLPGEYSTKVIISDLNNNVQEAYDSFTVKPVAWSPLGFDAVHPDGTYDGLDANEDNEILKGTTSIRFAVGVENSSQTELAYQFYVDSDNDGTFEPISDENTSSSSGGVSAVYNPRNLDYGIYETKVKITDLNDFSVELYDTFEVSRNVIPSWQITGLDSDDSDGILGGDDSNIKNIITQENLSINLTARIDNPDQALLSYQFQIDSNDDGTFEDIGSRQQISSSQDVFISYDTSNLNPGSYDTRIIVRDDSNLNAFTQELTRGFTVLPKTWDVLGIDTFDDHSSYGDSSDPSLENIADINNLPEGDHIHFSVGIDNPGEFELDYTFFIDNAGDDNFTEIFTAHSNSVDGINVLFDPRDYALGTYNVKVVISDPNGLQQFVSGAITITDNVSTATVNPWTLSGLDAIDNDGSFGGDDSNSVNKIIPGAEFITLAAGVNNVSQNILSYQFQIDTNNDGVFENIGEVQTSSSSAGLSLNYASTSLSSGTYNTKVIITDSDNLSQEATDSFQVKLPPLLGFDSVDSDGIVGGVDSNLNNSIKEGTSAIVMAASIDNPLGLPMNYRFSIDSDQDGTFEEIGAFVSANESISFNYNPQDLTPGSYDTKVEVFDDAGNNQFVEDSITIEPRANIVPWSIEGIDVVDFDKTFDDSDTNPANIIARGTDLINMTLGLDNPYKTGLTIQYLIDSDYDGTFEDITSSYTENNNSYAFYRTEDLGVGSYTIKAIVSDQSGISEVIYDVLRVEDVSNPIIEQPWLLNSFDAVDGVENNTISQGTLSMNLSVSVNNQFGEPLRYSFEIDSNNDGTFEKITEITTVEDKAVIEFDPSDFAPGNFNTKVTVSDYSGNSTVLNDQFTVEAKAWSLDGFDADSQRVTNVIVQGSESITLNTQVTNTENVLLTYSFQLDLDNNGVFEEYLSGKNINSSVSENLAVYNLGYGTYKAKVEVTDVNGLTSSVTDSFIINSAPEIEFDSVSLDTLTSNDSYNLISIGSQLNISMFDSDLDGTIDKYEYRILDSDNQVVKTEFDIDRASFISLLNNSSTTLLGGNYKVEISVTDNLGTETTVSQDFSILSIDAVQGDSDNTIQGGEVNFGFNGLTSETVSELTSYQYRIDGGVWKEFNDLDLFEKHINGSANKLGIGSHNLEVKVSELLGDIILSDSFTLTSLAPEGSYVSEVEIVNSSSNDLSNETVIITLDTATLISEGKLQANGEDLRFTSSDGVVELDYLIDSSTINTSETRIWVEIPELEVGSNKILLSYGNDQLSSQSDFESTFDKNTTFGVYDTFDGTTLDQDKWTLAGSAASYVSVNETLQFSGGASSWNSGFFSTQTYDRPFVFELEYKQTGGRYAMFGLHDSGTGASYTNLVHALYPVFDSNGNRFQVYEDSSKRGGDFNAITTDWMKFKIEVNETGADYYYKELSEESYTLVYSSSYSSEGNLRLGLANYDQAFEIDNLTVTPLTNNSNIATNVGVEKLNVQIDAVKDNSNNVINPGDSLDFTINNGANVDLNTNITGYEYRIDGGTWNTGFVDLNGLTTSVNSSAASLGVGNHSLEVKVIDVNLSEEIVSSGFSIGAGFDAVDSDTEFGNADSNPNNIVLEGSSSINLSAGVNNQSQESLDYTFQVDSDNDGTFETIGNLTTSDSITGQSVVFDTTGLISGSYQAKVIVQGSSFTYEVQDSITIINIVGLDSDDADGAYGDVDSNPTNEIAFGSSSINLTVGLENPGGANLTYEFFIDSDNDGNFELINSQDTTSSGSSYIYDPALLNVGAYNTKVLIKDEDGNVLGEVSDFFTII